MSANKSEAKTEIEMAKRFAIEVLRWEEGGWALIEEFVREMRGINPTTLTEHLGFTDQQVTLSEKVEGKPQWGQLSLYDVAYKVVSDEAVLQNRAFRRAALSGFAAFFRFVFGQTGREDQELLDWADEIATTLYGDNARLADRSRGKPAVMRDSASTASRQRRLKKRIKSDRDKEIRLASRGKQGQKPQHGGR